MEIKVQSKFEIGEIAKIKGSTCERIVISEIKTNTCPAGTQVCYVGIILVKKDADYPASLSAWKNEAKEPEPQWTSGKEALTISETLLEKIGTK